MVWVGESVTVPDACELDVTVRVVLPAVAVIVTVVAFVACQLRVMLCPEVIDVGLAVNCVTCGTTGCVTFTVAVCGAVLPPPPVATAE